MKLIRRDGFEPFSVQIRLARLRGLEADEVHGVGAKRCARPFLILFGADTPEGAARPAVFSQRRTTAAAP